MHITRLLPLLRGEPGECTLSNVNRPGFFSDFDLHWVLLPISVLKSSSLFFPDRQSELMRQQLRSNLPISISLDGDKSESTHFVFLSR